MVSVDTLESGRGISPCEEPTDERFELTFETRVGGARVFVNLENITDVRQTRYDPLLLPERGSGGRWTTDAWTDLTGFTMNAGVRLGC